MYNIELEKKGIRKGNKEISFAELIRTIRPYETDIVYIGGSLVEGQIELLSSGMGNSLSDLDVFIIRDHNNFERTDCVYDQFVKKTYFIDDIFDGVDVEVFDTDFINDLSKVLSCKKIDLASRTSNFFSDSLTNGGSYRLINSFLNRLRYSLCLYNKEKYNEVKNMIAFDRFLEIKKANQLVKIDNLLPDIVGNIDANQLDVALYCLRELYFETLEYILAHENIFVDRGKWIILKFKNLVKQKRVYLDLWREYESIFLSDLSNVSEARMKIDFATQMIQKTLEESLFAGGTI